MTQMMQEPPTDAELDAIDRACNAATPGPWKSFIEGRDHTGGSHFIRTGGEDIELCGPARIADQDFIADARQSVPLLVAEVRRLRARIAELENRST